MRTCICLGLIVATGFLHAGTGGKEDPGALLDKAIAAQGGAERIAKNKMLKFRAKGTLDLFGMSMKFTADYAFAHPDKLRFSMDATFMDKPIKMLVVCDGAKGWEQAEGMTREMDKEKLDEFKHTAYVVHISSLLPLKDKSFKLTPLPEATEDGKTLVGFNVSHKGRRDVKLFFDKKTLLLAKTETRVLDEFAMKEVTQENLFSGYHDKGGRKVFDKMVIKRDGKTFLSEEFSDQAESGKVDPKLFAEPK